MPGVAEDQVVGSTFGTPAKDELVEVLPPTAGEGGDLCGVVNEPGGLERDGVIHREFLS